MNDRILKLEKINAKTHSNEIENVLRYQQKRAFSVGGAGKINKTTNTASRYSTRKSKTKREAVSRLHSLISGIESKTSTITGLKEINAKRKASLELYIRKHLIKDENFTLTESQYDMLGKAFGAAQGKSIDSSTVISGFVKSTKHNLFKNADEIIDFLEKNRDRLIESSIDDLIKQREKEKQERKK